MKLQIYAIAIVIVFMATIFAPMVTAEDYTTKSIEVNLEPGITDGNSTVVNIADTESIPLESDIVYDNLPIGTEGKFYGPYLQSSLFQFSTSGGYFQFASNFTVGSDVIMNGVSNLWVRIPIVPSQYNYWQVVVTWDERFNTIEIGPGSWTHGIDNSYQKEKTLALPFILPSGVGDEYIYLHTSYGLGNYIGNYWSSSNSSSSLYYETSNGLYLNLKGLFLSDKEFTIGFTGQLKAGESPLVYITQELIQDSYTYRFFDIGRLGSVTRFKYDYNVELQLAPAFSFVFLNGIGKFGMLSYNLDFTGEQSLSFYGYEHEWLNESGVLQTTYRMLDQEEYVNGSRLSFFMPFSVVSNLDHPQESSIDWEVTMYLRDFSTNVYTFHPWYFIDDGVQTNEVTFQVNDTSSYLLFTSPYQIYVPINYNSVDHCQVMLTIRPVQNCTLKLLANVQGDELTDGNDLLLQGNYDLGLKSKIDGVTDCNQNQFMPIFNSVAMTTTLWVQITETALYDIYDFGWGQGYHFPGETSIYLFADDGGQYIFNGSYAGFVDDWENRNEDNSLIAQVLKAIKNFGGWIWDGITYIWDTLVGIGQWISNVITSIIDFIVTIAKDVIGKVTNLVQGFIYGLPIIITLFVVNYAGQMLQTGHIVTPRKEIRKLKRLRKVVNKKIAKPLIKRGEQVQNWVREDNAKAERIRSKSFKSYGDAVAKRYVADAEQYGKDKRQFELQQEQLAKVGRAKEAREEKEITQWQSDEVKAINRANAKVEKLEDVQREKDTRAELEYIKETNIKNKIKDYPTENNQKIMVTTDGKEKVDTTDYSSDKYLHTLTREELKRKTETKGIRKQSKAQQEFGAWRTEQDSSLIKKKKDEDTRRKLEQEKARRDAIERMEAEKAKPQEPNIVYDWPERKDEPMPETVRKSEVKGDALTQLRKELKTDDDTRAQRNEANLIRNEQRIVQSERIDARLEREGYVLKSMSKADRKKAFDKLQNEEKEKANRQTERKKTEQELAIIRAKEAQIAHAREQEEKKAKEEEKAQQEEYEKEFQAVQKANRANEAKQAVIDKANAEARIRAEADAVQEAKWEKERQREMELVRTANMKKNTLNDGIGREGKTSVEINRDLTAKQMLEFKADPNDPGVKARRSDEYLALNKKERELNEAWGKTKSKKKQNAIDEQLKQVEQDKKAIENKFEEQAKAETPKEQKPEEPKASIGQVRYGSGPPVPKEDWFKETAILKKKHKSKADKEWMEEFNKKYRPDLIAFEERHKAETAKEQKPETKKADSDWSNYPSASKAYKDKMGIKEEPAKADAKAQKVEPIHERYPQSESNSEWVNQQLKDKAKRSDYATELDDLKFEYQNMNNKDKAEFREYTIKNHPETAKLMKWKSKGESK